MTAMGLSLAGARTVDRDCKSAMTNLFPVSYRGAAVPLAGSTRRARPRPDSEGFVIKYV